MACVTVAVTPLSFGCELRLAEVISDGLIGVQNVCSVNHVSCACNCGCNVALVVLTDRSLSEIVTMALKGIEHHRNQTMLCMEVAVVCR